MKPSAILFVAKRMLFSRKKKTAVNVISWIAVLGMIVSSSALVILLSAFNGIEKMIEKMYTSFDQELTIMPAEGKRFSYDKALGFKKKCEENGQVKSVSLYIKERVILRKKKKWVNAELFGVEPSFYTMAELENEKHLINGVLDNQQGVYVGVGLANRLMLRSMEAEPEQVMLYTPKQNVKIKVGQNPFFQKSMVVNGAVDYNKQINEVALIVPLQSVLPFTEQKVSGLLISCDPENTEALKIELMESLGKEVKVQSNQEKNELVYKTSQSEKLMVIVILMFVFLLSLFNLSASITMTFLEKQSSLISLISIGFSRKNIQQLFFYIGIGIVIMGVLAGTLIGTSVAFLQENIGLIKLPGSTMFFPSSYSLAQVVLFASILMALGAFLSFLISGYLTKSAFNNKNLLDYR